MKRTNLFIFAAVLALLAAALACSFNFSSASIEEAWTSFDQDGAQRTTVYEQGDTFYAIVVLDNAPDETVVKAVFIAVDVEGEEPNTEIDLGEVTTGSGQAYFSLSPAQLWPAGQYKVDIYMDDEFDRSLSYQVKGSVAPAPPTPAPTKPQAPPPPTSPPEAPPTKAPETSPLGNPDASAPGEVFFETEFEDSENWYIMEVPETEEYEAYTERSVLYIQVDTTETTVYALYKMDLNNPDVRLEADVETVAGPNRNNISLVCRATEDGWYEFSMNSGGYWYIWKYEDGKFTKLRDGASTAIILQKAKNQLEATCIGSELILYVNGVKMGSVQDSSFRGGGQAGISVTTFDIYGAGVEFDHFKASVP